MENVIKMDDLGVPLFLETPILVNLGIFPQLGVGHEKNIWSHLETWRTKTSPDKPASFELQPRIGEETFQMKQKQQIQWNSQTSTCTDDLENAKLAVFCLFLRWTVFLLFVAAL